MTTTDSRPLTLTFTRIADLALALGAAPMYQYEGCWEHQIDKLWWIAVNGHREPRECSKGVSVPPFNAYVVFNDWPAGIIDPYGGVIAAGEAANEETLLAALDEGIRQAASA